MATWLAKQHAKGLVGIHSNFPTLFPPPIEGEPNAEEIVAHDPPQRSYFQPPWG